MLPLFRHLGVAAFGKVRPTATRLTRSLIGGAVAGIFGLTAYVALLLALGFYLSSELGAVYAALIVALLTAVCAVIVLMVVQGMNKATERRAEARQRAARSRLPDPMTLQMLAGVPAMMRGRSLLTTAAIAALVFGVAKMQGVGRDDRDD
jgi:fucose 4-O-acetylase-like acetyltransferase